MASCKKEAGPGGSSSIKGYVHVTDYNANMLIVQGEYPGVDQDVYIVYGNDIQYGDRIRSGPDGRFEFEYLQKGDYTIYLYSDDTTLSGTTFVSKKIHISKNHEHIDGGTFEIKKK
ncbi:MAG: hypothetical protein WCO63_07205 [Bacteroidota bacterium]